MTKRIFVTAALLIVGACSSGDGRSGAIGIAGSSAPIVPPAAGSAAGASAPAGSGAGTGASGRGVAGQGTGTAGQSGVTTAGVTAPPIAGAAGGLAAGTGAPAAGAPAAGSGGAVAGRGAAGGAAGAAGGGTAGMGGSTPGTVMVQFTTVSYGGEYAPLNYGAVWFEDAGGKFLKTAKRWAGTVHASDLVAWTEASGGWPVFGGGNADMMDAMSSATIRTHQMHTITWNMMDAQKQLVPDGEYVAKIEMSESRARDRAGPVLEIKFTKGSMPQTVEVPNQASFTGVVLRYMP